MSNPKVITEENNREDIAEWYASAKTQTFETLPSFIQHVMNEYVHDYGTVVHAIAACAIATAWACNRMEGAAGGITGFQASCLMWSFVRHWQFENNKCGLRILDYDDLLYPQYGYKFEKAIPERVWESVQKEARERYEEAASDMESGKPFCTSGAVMAHWKSIANGELPFGFVVKES